MKKGFVLFFLVLCVPVFVFAGYFDEPLYGSTGSHITSLSEVANSLQKIKPALKRLMALPVLNAPHYGEKFRFNPTDFSYEHKISFGEKNQIVNIQTTFKLAEKFLDTATYDDIEPLVFTCLELIALEYLQENPQLELDDIAHYIGSRYAIMVEYLDGTMFTIVADPSEMSVWVACYPHIDKFSDKEGIELVYSSGTE